MSNSKDESLTRHPTIEIKEDKFIGLPLKIKETFFPAILLYQSPSDP
jgi:hypothetical protein